MIINTFSTKIEGVTKYVTKISTEQETKTKPRTPVTHHILLIDRSGSMYAELNGLLDQVNETIDHISPDDYLSIMWYSGVGRFESVVIGARANADIKGEIDKLRRTVGTTCFSDPLRASSNLVSQLQNVVDQTSIILFTDGQPVVNWSIDEEKTRCINIVKDMAVNGLSSMTCIGYGNYYGRDFLIEIADQTDHGKIMHNSRIEEFLDSFKSSIGATSSLIRTPFNIDVSTNVDILYSTEQNTALHTNVDKLDLASTSAYQNDFYLISDTNDFDITVNDEGLNSGEVTKKTGDNDKLTFGYAYASKLYYYGKRKKALSIIVNSCKDKHLANLMVNAFTNAEVADVQKALDTAVHNKDTRYVDGKCTADFLPKRDALCVMDIFKDLFDPTASVYYIPFSSNVDRYSRIGKKVEDKQNAFTADSREVRMPLSKFIWAKEKLNLNILISIPGNVRLNPKSAKSVNLPADYPAIIYNTHTFVKDGTLNIKKAEFLIDDVVYSKLVKRLKDRVTVLPDAESNLYRVVVDFNGLPIINQTYIDESNDLDVVYSLVKDNMELEAKIRVVNNQIDEMYEANPDLKMEGVFETLTADQIRVLSEHGITDKGVYSGIDRQASKEDADSYEVRILEFSLAGYKTIPAVKEFKKMVESTKTVTSGPGKIMVAYYKDLQGKFQYEFEKGGESLRESLNTEKKTLQNRLLSNRQKLAEVKLSKILNNDFWDNLSKDDKGNLFFEKDLKMNVKSERKMQSI